jgi:hypothetical protein
MPSESENKRYRDGYAAGQRDGNTESGIEMESQRRSPTGDTSSDEGYSEGFAASRQSRPDGFRPQSADLFKQMNVLPQISGWLKRVAGRSQ